FPGLHGASVVLHFDGQTEAALNLDAVARKITDINVFADAAHHTEIPRRLLHQGKFLRSYHEQSLFAWSQIAIHRDRKPRAALRYEASDRIEAALDQVRFADELRDEPVSRLLIQLMRRP